jgi:hypothetical protein
MEGWIFQDDIVEELYASSSGIWLIDRKRG